MASLTIADRASRTAPMAAKNKWTPKKEFHPGGEKGKLHREMGVPEGDKIPAGDLEAATHSKNPEIRRDAIRAETMKKWHHGGHKSKASSLYDHKRS
jgi:hypothetical protein